MYTIVNTTFIVISTLMCFNYNKYIQYILFGLEKYNTHALYVIDTVFIQEMIRSDLRFFVVGILFLVEGFGLFLLMCLVKLFDENWRYA